MQKKKYNKNLTPPGTAFLSSYCHIITLRISKLVRVLQSLSLECLTLHFTYLKDLCPEGAEEGRAVVGALPIPPASSANSLA